MPFLLFCVFKFLLSGTRIFFRVDIPNTDRVTDFCDQESDLEKCHPLGNYIIMLGLCSNFWIRSQGSLSRVLDEEVIVPNFSMTKGSRAILS